MKGIEKNDKKDRTNETHKIQQVPTHLPLAKFTLPFSFSSACPFPAKIATGDKRQTSVSGADQDIYNTFKGLGNEEAGEGVYDGNSDVC
jgi:hypothetical protein